MRFAILSPIYPYRGGIAQFSGMLYTELVKEGHEVKAFNFKRLYPDILFPGKTQYVEAGDRAIEIESVRVLDSVNPVSYFSTVNAIRSYAPDVLIISYWMSFFVPGYAHVANRMKKHCKVITLIHNAIPHEPRFFDKPLASLLFKQCHGQLPGFFLIHFFNRDGTFHHILEHRHMGEKVKLLEHHSHFLTVNIYINLWIRNIGTLKENVTACRFFKSVKATEKS